MSSLSDPSQLRDARVTTRAHTLAASIHERLEEAAFPGLDPHRALALATEAATPVRVVLARNPDLHPQVAALLADDRRPEVRRALASSHTLAPEVTAQLALDPDAEVRYVLAREGVLTASDVARLSCDTAPVRGFTPVWEGLRDNDSLPWDVLEGALLDAHLRQLGVPLMRERPDLLERARLAAELDDVVWSQLAPTWAGDVCSLVTACELLTTAV